MVAAGFLGSHPDLRYRSLGLEEFGEGKYSEAFQKFRRAAYYSDKPSQAIIGEMLWVGVGVQKDRALAYVWMGLAAERGYTSFSKKRDRYWSELGEMERVRARQEGPAIRAEYRDVAAEPRLQVVLNRERNKATGSRTGSTATPMKIVVPGVGTLDSSQYYDPKYWDPKQYRMWQDSIWQELRIGRVDVGEVEQVTNDAAPPPFIVPDELLNVNGDESPAPAQQPDD